MLSERQHFFSLHSLLEETWVLIHEAERAFLISRLDKDGLFTFWIQRVLLLLHFKLLFCHTFGNKRSTLAGKENLAILAQTVAKATCVWIPYLRERSLLWYNVGGWDYCLLLVQRGRLYVGSKSQVFDRFKGVLIRLRQSFDVLDGAFEDLCRPRKSILDIPARNGAKGFAEEVEGSEEIISDDCLNWEVILELSIVLDNFVSRAFELMNERTCAPILQNGTLGVGQVVGTVLARSKRTLQGASIRQFKAVKTLSCHKDKD